MTKTNSNNVSDDRFKNISSSQFPTTLFPINSGDASEEIPVAPAKAMCSANDHKKGIATLPVVDLQPTNSGEECSSRQNLKPIPYQLPAQATHSPANDDVPKVTIPTTLPETELQSKFWQLMAILDKNPRLDVDSEDGKSDNGEFTRLAYDIYHGLYQEVIDKAEKNRQSETEDVFEDEAANYLDFWLKKELKKYFEAIEAKNIKLFQVLEHHIDLINSWQCDAYQYQNYDSTEPFLADFIIARELSFQLDVMDKANPTFSDKANQIFSNTSRWKENVPKVYALRYDKEKNFWELYRHEKQDIKQRIQIPALNELLADKKIEDIRSGTDPDCIKIIREITFFQWGEPGRLQSSREHYNERTACVFQAFFRRALTKLREEAEALQATKKKAANQTAAISKLEQYIKERETKGNYDSKYELFNPQRNSNTFFKSAYETVNNTLNVFGLGAFREHEKTGAANKIIQYIKNPSAKINFKPRELGAAQQGNLGKQVQLLIDAKVLPVKFFEQQRIQLAKQPPKEQTQERRTSHVAACVRALLIFIPTLALIADCFLSGVDFVEALI